jgi:hypothetical protein
MNAREARQRAMSGFFCGERYQGTGVLQTALSAHEARTFRGSVGPLVVGAHVGADDFCCGDFAFDVARQRLRRVGLVEVNPVHEFACHGRVFGDEMEKASAG